MSDTHAQHETIRVAVTADDLYAAAREIERGNSVSWLSLEAVNVELVDADREFGS